MNSNQEAISRWEGEGGSTPVKSAVMQATASAETLAALPAGYTAQLNHGFKDRSQNHLYEFHLAYRPVTRVLDGVKSTLDKLDPSKCFWIETWSTRNAQGEERASMRWISYEQANKKPRSPLTFEQFSQLTEELPGLLEARG